MTNITTLPDTFPAFVFALALFSLFGGQFICSLPELGKKRFLVRSSFRSVHMEFFALANFEHIGHV
jgi:hypothetical protein